MGCHWTHQQSTQMIPSHYEDVVEISVQNTIDQNVSISRGRKVTMMVPMIYYQLEIYGKIWQPQNRGQCNLINQKMFQAQPIVHTNINGWLLVFYSQITSIILFTNAC